MGNSDSVVCNDNPCTHQPRCVKPCAIKCCVRVHYPYVGWAGTLGFISEAFVVTWFVLMLLDIVPQNGSTILILLLLTAILALILWAWTVFKCAPHYATASTFCGVELACPLIVRPSVSDYACRLAWDGRHKNDQAHTQTLLKGAIFSLILMALFIGPGRAGIVGFSNLAIDATQDQFRLFVIAKVLIALFIASIGINFSLYLLETNTDFIVRHLSAINEQYKEKNGGEQLYLGAEKQTASKNYASLRSGGGLPGFS